MKWDYIVVGAGSAGCALIHELTSQGKSVLALEAGGSDASPFIKIPAAIWHMGSRFDWGYRAQPDLSRGGIVESWRCGRVIGGTSCINGMVYVRGAPEDFDRWSQKCAGQGRWNASDVTPIFEGLESSDNCSPYRGHRGGLFVRTVRRPHILSHAFVESACNAGSTYNDDYNGRTQHGVSYMQFSQRAGLRWTAADAFLKPHLKRENLRLLTNVCVERLDISAGHVRSVRFRHGTKQLQEHSHHVVLCAGAINSPKLLMLSGIGNSCDLDRIGIQVTQHTPAVGMNLLEHPYAQLNYRMRIPSYNLTEGFHQKFAIGLQYLMRREGPLAAVYEAAAFLKMSPESTAPDFQVLFAPIGWSGEIAGEGLEGRLKLSQYPAVKILVLRSHTASSGRVRLASSNPASQPIIEYEALSDLSDVNALVKGVTMVRQIMQTPPMKDLVDVEMAPGPLVDSPESLAYYLRDHTELACHPSGTCRMGLGPDSVVGPDLRVHGIENLWIADASIMPDAISANLNAPCMMIGSKLGRQLLER